MLNRFNTRDREALQVAIAGVAIGLAALAPAVMIFSRDIPPLLAAVAFCLLMGSISVGGRVLELRASIADALSTPAVVALGILLGLMALSLVWSLAPWRGSSHFLQVSLTAGAIGGLLLGSRVAPQVFLPGGLGLWLAAGLCVTASVTVLAAVAAGYAQQAGVGVDSSRLNRGAVAITLFLPISLFLLDQGQERWALFPVGVVACTGVLFSDSESAKLALLGMAAVTPFARLRPKATHRVIGVCIVTAMLGIPLLGPVINKLIPASVHAVVGYNTLTLRGEIWGQYSTLIAERPLLGFGIESSDVISRRSDLTSEARRVLTYGHPHSAPLQIWFELGLAGALVSSALVGLTWHRLLSLPCPFLPVLTVSGTGAVAVWFVSHGAWQAWWYSLLGLAAFLWAVLLTSAASVDYTASRRADTLSSSQPPQAEVAAPHGGA